MVIFWHVLLMGSHPPGEHSVWDLHGRDPGLGERLQGDRGAQCGVGEGVLQKNRRGELLAGVMVLTPVCPTEREGKRSLLRMSRAHL